MAEELFFKFEIFFTFKLIRELLIKLKPEKFKDFIKSLFLFCEVRNKFTCLEFSCIFSGFVLSIDEDDIIYKFNYYFYNFKIFNLIVFKIN